MTALEAMGELDVYSPNTLDEAIKYKWLSAAERHAREIINTYNIEKEYETKYEIRTLSPETDADEELVVPEPYSELYKYYLLAQINLLYGDTAKYNVFAQLYDSALNEFRLWCVRNYRSKNENSTLGVI